MIDDDATADRRWVEELAEVYRETDAVAVGGRMEPDWVAGAGVGVARRPDGLRGAGAIVGGEPPRRQARSRLEARRR
jgi:hypothetical protein